MKNKTLIIINIILLIGIIIALIFFMIWGMIGRFPGFSGNGKLMLEKHYQVSDIKKIKMDLKNYDIEIIDADSSDIKLEVYSNKKNNNIITEEANNTLEVRQSGSTFCFGFCYTNQKVILTVPKNQDLLFLLNTISGDISTNVNFKARENMIRTTSGDITLADIDSGEVKSVSGNITISEINKGTIATVSGDVRVMSLKEGDVDTTSGDINIKKANVVDINSTSGEIDIDSLKGNGNLATTSGDINIKHFEILNNTSVNSTSGDVIITLNNEAFITTNTRSGDVKVKNMRGEYELKIETISGDIVVR